MQLVVQVKTVGQHKQGCTQQIFQKLMGVEYHRKALARTLCVPEYPDFTVIALQGLFGTVNSFLYGKILMIAGQNASFFVHTHCEREICDNINKTMFGENAIEECLKVGKCRAFITSVRGFPLHISVERCGNRTHPGVCHITNHKHLTSGKELRNNAHIVLQLLVCFLRVGNFT